MTIRIRDVHGMVPEIFASSEFEPDLYHFDLEVLPCFGQYNIKPSSVPTIFINTEPDVHSAADEYQHLVEARPNCVFAVTAWSQDCPWGWDHTIDYYSNFVYVIRRNSLIYPVTGGRKRWTANALLGGWMRSRLNMFEAIKQADALEDTLITFMCRDTEQIEEWSDPRYVNYRSPAVAQFDVKEFLDMAYRDDRINTMVKLATNHGAGWISHIIPYEIYNNSYVSIVSETVNLQAPDTFYISEKIAKPLLLAQPFWVHGCQGYLRHLQDLGFRTYGDHWDESYDDIEDSDQRARAMMHSYLEFQALERQEKIDIIDRCREISAHNRRLIQDPDFLFGNLKSSIRSLVSK